MVYFYIEDVDKAPEFQTAMEMNPPLVGDWIHYGRKAYKVTKRTLKILPTNSYYWAITLWHMPGLLSKP